uniref:Uncharacterized protein n=1 Tax=Anguilla anguilla TaxID=7936 RepID=A0A0E9TQY1_ANGAN
MDSGQKSRKLLKHESHLIAPEQIWRPFCLTALMILPAVLCRDVQSMTEETQST